MKRIKVIFVVSFVFALSMVQINAQIVTDRPDQTESAVTVGSRNLQLEAGLGIAFEGDDQFSTRNILAPTTLFRYGITEGIELRILSQFESVKWQDQVTQGISDLQIGAKIQVFKKEDVNAEIAFISHLLVPIGTTEISNGSFGTINKLAISHELTENMNLGYNVGYDYLGTGRGDLVYSVALGLGVNDKVGIFVEPFGRVIDFVDFRLNFDAGLTYLAKENLQFDFSFGTGINQRMNYISVGCCWKIEGQN